MATGCRSEFRVRRTGRRRLVEALLGGVVGCATPVFGGEPLVRILSSPSPAATARESAPIPSSPAPPAPVRPVRTAAPDERAPPPAPEQPSPDRYPIDLATALRLAGANNLQIALTAERVRQAQARQEGAQSLWVPSLNAGVAYTKHEGTLQDTRGQVIDVSRNALFVGGGPNLGPAPLAGPAGAPRLFLGLPLVDALFTPLAERQTVQAARAAATSTFNDTLLQVALAYQDLLQAQGQVAVAREAVENAEELHRLVESRVRAGTAPPADGLRARAEVAERQRQRFQAEEGVRAASAELVRLVRLDPAVLLVPLEDPPCPVPLVETDVPLPQLIAQALVSRPELAQQQALVSAAVTRLRQEQWRPFVPTLQLGLSAGGFGGGPGSAVGNFDGRMDFDALVVWEVRNLGFGNRALRRERASRQQQAGLELTQWGDRVAAEVTRAYYQVQFRRRQVEAAQDQVQAAAEAVPLNLKGILGGDLRAIEGQQAVQGLAVARNQYLAALTDFNRAQFQLLRALGQAPPPPPPAFH